MPALPNAKRRGFLRHAGLGAAGLTMTGLGAVETIQAKANPEPCPVVSSGPQRLTGPIRQVRAGGAPRGGS
jgi:hypothetical protein